MKENWVMRESPQWKAARENLLRSMEDRRQLDKIVFLQGEIELQKAGHNIPGLLSDDSDDGFAVLIDFEDGEDEDKISEHDSDNGVPTRLLGKRRDGNRWIPEGSFECTGAQHGEGWHNRQADYAHEERRRHRDLEQLWDVLPDSALPGILLEGGRMKYCFKLQRVAAISARKHIGEIMAENKRLRERADRERS